MKTEMVNIYKAPEFKSLEEFDTFLQAINKNEVPVYTTATITEVEPEDDPNQLTQDERYSDGDQDDEDDEDDPTQLTREERYYYDEKQQRRRGILK